MTDVQPTCRCQPIKSQTSGAAPPPHPPWGLFIVCVLTCLFLGRGGKYVRTFFKPLGSCWSSQCNHHRHQQGALCPDTYIQSVTVSAAKELHWTPTSPTQSGEFTVTVTSPKEQIIKCQIIPFPFWINRLSVKMFVTFYFWQKNKKERPNYTGLIQVHFCS